MACLKPILAYDYGVQDNGKRKIRILKPDEYHDLSEKRSFEKTLPIMMLLCGHCSACAQDYARMWQLRIMCEGEYYNEKCFITLTYKNPSKPNKEDARAFVKSLRNRFGRGIRFFICGEIGSQTKRFHLHGILFGVDFSSDRVPVSKRGLNLVYTSKTLDKIWSKGFTSIGELDVASAGYVSQYCTKKKITGQNDGEFIIMSRGLGKRYFEEHKKELFNSDYIYLKGNRFKIPRYFLKLADQDGFYMSVLADDLRERRFNVARQFRYDKCRSVETEEQGIVQASKIALAHFSQEESFRDVL